MSGALYKQWVNRQLVYCRSQCEAAANAAASLQKQGFVQAGLMQFERAMHFYFAEILSCPPELSKPLEWFLNSEYLSGDFRLEELKAIYRDNTAWLALVVGYINSVNAESGSSLQQSGVALIASSERYNDWQGLSAKELGALILAFVELVERHRSLSVEE